MLDAEAGQREVGHIVGRAAGLHPVVPVITHLGRARMGQQPVPRRPARAVVINLVCFETEREPGKHDQRNHRVGPGPAAPARYITDQIENEEWQKGQQIAIKQITREQERHED